VLIIDSLKNFGDIPSGQTARNPSPFIFMPLSPLIDSTLDFALLLNCENYSIIIPFYLTAGYQSPINEKMVIKRLKAINFNKKELNIFNPLGQKVKKEKIKRGIYFIKENNKKKKFIILL
jgi:hypothetical protein